MEFALQMRSVSDQPRVLVVERNRTYLGVLARRLAEFGYRVATADNAQAALAEMYRIPVDLVLADANLPGTSGIELVRMIRHDPVHAPMPVLLVVGRSESSAAVDALRAGADGVVRKPCHFDVLGATIARQIERADAVKRLAGDKAALDAKIISRVIELREAQEELRHSEAERRRLAAIVEGKAA
ncbi:response regulator [Sphingomonas sabuli]|uniref:Response regulator n=1 Tax=Sphingomonas sabuli TaxID=2764186 RepID=A0A7G9KZH7_9SPHN|nr:response regulator [Sphingomonas sabuli]QNM81776.1 response regulator [Sphingomonas sabuli]